ncbi:MAG: hypothetical protein LWW86_06910 [Micrococcales bacterium]|nr:hypothetical protein [Micrococcales bacterium]
MTSPTSPGVRARASLVHLGWLLLLVALWALAWAIAPDHNANGQCEGIGWGCTLTPRDGLLFAGLFIGTPVLAAALVAGLAAIMVLADRRVWRPLALGTVGTLIGMAFALTAAALVGVVALLT